MHRKVSKSHTASGSLIVFRFDRIFNEFHDLHSFSHYTLVIVNKVKNKTEHTWKPKKPYFFTLRSRRKHTTSAPRKIRNGEDRGEQVKQGPCDDDAVVNVQKEHYGHRGIPHA